MIALYRKYRPRTLEDLIGQDEVVLVIKQAAIKDRFGHGYLFYGPRGTGKTSTARIVAKLANCIKRKEDATFAKKGVPCNECVSCTAIEKGIGLDVMELDAASNRGIDDIRDLQEHIKTLPSSSSYKVIIVDEVHMLTPQAFNALLKTLEEPPAHVIFILATTEYEKLPATIVSRTQQFHFVRPSLQNITKKLKYIANEERIPIAPDAIELIAYSADGSVRDAESLLDQLASLQEEITVATIERILGKADFSRIITMAGYCIEGDLEKALTLLYQFYADGYNLFQFTKDLIIYLRRTLSLSLTPSLLELFSGELTQAELSAIQEHAKKVDPKKIAVLLKSLISAYSQMRYNPIPIVPLEVAIITSLQ